VLKFNSGVIGIDVYLFVFCMGAYEETSRVCGSCGVSVSLIPRREGWLAIVVPSQGTCSVVVQVRGKEVKGRGVLIQVFFQVVCDVYCRWCGGGLGDVAVGCGDEGDVIDGEVLHY